LDSRNDEAAGAADTAAGSTKGGGGIVAIVAFVGLVTYLVSYDAPTSSTAKLATPKSFAAAQAQRAAPRAAPEDGIAEPQAFGPIKFTPAEPDEDIATATIAETAAAPVAMEDAIAEPQAFGPIKFTPAEPEDDFPTASIAKRVAAHPKASIKPALHAAHVAHHTAKPQSGMNHYGARARHGSPCPRPACDLPSAKSALL
jgi:hypothetical protein